MCGIRSCCACFTLKTSYAFVLLCFFPGGFLGSKSAMWHFLELTDVYTQLVLELTCVLCRPLLFLMFAMVGVVGPAAYGLTCVPMFSSAWLSCRLLSCFAGRPKIMIFDTNGLTIRAMDAKLPWFCMKSCSRPLGLVLDLKPYFLKQVPVE